MYGKQLLVAPCAFSLGENEEMPSISFGQDWQVSLGATDALPQLVPSVLAVSRPKPAVSMSTISVQNERYIQTWVRQDGADMTKSLSFSETLRAPGCLFKLCLLVC